MMIGALSHVTFSVRDLDRAFAFYHRVLGLRALARWDRGAYFLAGETTWVTLSLDPTTESTPPREYTHVAFSATAESFAVCCRRIRLSGAREWQTNSSEGDSLYFLDPDGHKLELHVGDWRSRLAACRAKPYQGMVIYETD